MPHHAALRARIQQSEIRHPPLVYQNSQAPRFKIAPILLLLSALCLMRAGSAVVGEANYSGATTGLDAPLEGD